MKKTNKKIIGGLITLMVIATIGAVLVSAETNDITENGENIKSFYFGRGRAKCGEPPFFSELTDEQKLEIQTLMEDLKSSDATPEEIHTAISEKLESWGIDVPTRDEQLDSAIERTGRHLELLQRQKELREEGKTWEEIQEIIQEEFDLEFPEDCGQGPKFKHGFGRMHGRCSEDIPEDSEF